MWSWWDRRLWSGSGGLRSSFQRGITPGNLKCYNVALAVGSRMGIPGHGHVCCSGHSPGHCREVVVAYGQAQHFSDCAMKMVPKRMNTRFCIQQRKDSQTQAALVGRKLMESSSWHGGRVGRTCPHCRGLLGMWPRREWTRMWMWMEHKMTCSKT